MGIGVALGFLLCLLFFNGIASPVYADEVLLPTFGKGKVQVRLYTEYFCGPCSHMETKIEPLLKNLVQRNVITLTFVDTPVHTLTPLYARYFLYIFNQDRGFDQALKSRTFLFGAARDKIGEKERLEDYLRAHEVKFKECDPQPTFAALSALINEDKVKSTPTCVIVKEEKKAAFTGEVQITNALELLK